MTAPVAAPASSGGSATGISSLPPGEGLGERKPSLTEHFTTIASAPNGIRKLRELILELAVRGKLVQQRPNDEPAYELLKRASKEREKLAAERARTRTFEVSPISAEEASFEVPQGWALARLPEVARYRVGKTPPTKDAHFWAGGEIPWVSISDLNHNGCVDVTSRLVTSAAAKDVFKCPPARAGSILMSFKLTLGKISRLSVDAYHNEAIISLVPFDGIETDYLFKVLPEIARSGRSKNALMGDTLNSNSLAALVIPIPPQAEQHRIVAKVDELMALCDQLEAQQADAEAAHEKMVRELLATFTKSQSTADFQSNWQRLATHFDTLFTTEASIQALQQALLQISVRGRLVPQGLGSESAGALLKGILEKKAGARSGNLRSKSRVPDKISEEEAPFTLPDSWVWARCEWICDVIVDCPHSTPNFQANGLLCLDTNSFKQGRLIEERFRFVSRETFEERNRRLIPEAGDVVFAREGSVGESVVIPEGVRCCLGQRVMLFRPLGVLPEYFRLAISEPGSLSRLLSLHKGIGAKHVNVADMRAALIPLPPIEEQQRILAKLDDLNALADVLRKNIGQLAKVSESLASTLASKALA